MKITRIYTGKDEQSHFEEIEIPLFDQGDIGRLSKIFSARGVIFRENPGDYHYQWHNAPRRQYIVLLEGSVEIEIGDGRVVFFIQERSCWRKTPPDRGISAEPSMANRENRSSSRWIRNHEQMPDRHRGRERNRRGSFPESGQTGIFGLRQFSSRSDFRAKTGM